MTVTVKNLLTCNNCKVTGWLSKTVIEDVMNNYNSFKFVLFTFNLLFYVGQK